MKVCTKCKQNKELIEFNKDRSKKDGLSSWCKICRHISTDKWAKTSTGKISTRLSGKKCYQTIQGKANKIAYKRKRSKTPEGKAQSCADAAKRRAKKLHATLKWLNKEHFKQIKKFYIEAIRLTNKTGILHHVDHIVPLQGKNVSGLHVPWNLQVIPAFGPNGNCSKGNRT